jgi:hypothetical protein
LAITLFSFPCRGREGQSRERQRDREGRKEGEREEHLNDLPFSITNAVNLLDHVDHQDESTLRVEMPTCGENGKEGKERT